MDNMGYGQVVQWLSKKESPKSKNRRRINVYCLASVTLVGLVHARSQEKTDRKIVKVTDSCF